MIIERLKGLATDERLDISQSKDDKNWTPLHHVIQHHPEAIPYLLAELSAEQCMILLTIKDSDGDTPLHVATKYQPEAIPSLLQQQNSQPNSVWLC